MSNAAELKQSLKLFNNLYRKMDEIYHYLARNFGLSDCAFWILYTIRETERPCTQSEIGNMLCISKQTVNSALKGLSEAGYIEMSALPDNRKNKRITLTAKGEQLAAETVDRVLAMEQRCWDDFAPKDRELFLNFNQQYVDCLQQGAEALLGAAIK